MIEFIDLPMDFDGKRDCLKDWLIRVASSHDMRIKELQYHIVDNDEMLVINKSHLDHDFDTDVITFPYGSKRTIKGEVFINKDFIKKSALSLNVAYQYEFLRILAHGLLHLIGFDDTSTELKEEMSRQEDNALSLQTFFNPKFHVEQ